MGKESVLLLFDAPHPCWNRENTALAGEDPEMLELLRREGLLREEGGVYALTESGKERFRSEAAECWLDAVPGDFSGLKYFNFAWTEFNGAKLMVSRTGYTGELGYELFLPASQAVALWEAIAADPRVAPAGLGARDTLRLEMCYPLNGSDLSPERTPIEAGLGFFVDLEKPEFMGREVLARQKAEGHSVRLTAIQYTEKGAPPRAHYPVTDETGAVVGELCSGVLSPSMMTGIGMAYLPAALAKPGTPLKIDVRGRLFPAQVVKKPFYRKA